MREFGILLKNKPEKVLCHDLKDMIEDGPSQQEPNIFMTVQDTFGEGSFNECDVLHLRIGDKVVFSDINLPEALAGLIQLYFCFNLLYPPAADDLMQVWERMICQFGSKDDARNKKGIVKNHSGILR